MVLQSAVSQTYGEHAFFTGLPQLPAPSQYAGGVAMPAAQLGVAQVVDVPGGAPHLVRSEPSHAAWQAPVPEHTVRTPCGLPTIGRQLPSLPERSHASHWLLQADPQQKPSTQKLEPHSLPAVHAAPFGFEQVPAPFALHT